MMKELIDRINTAGVFTPCYLEDDIDMGEAAEVATIDLDEHRWYTLGTVVYRLGDEFFGVRGPVSLKSESMDWESVGRACEAFPMEQVPSVTYRRKV